MKCKNQRIPLFQTTVQNLLGLNIGRSKLHEVLWVGSHEFQQCLRLEVRLIIRILKALLKVAFIQKALVNLSFLQTDEPNYFPELIFFSF